MEPSKRVWIRPQLIILSRGTPEESVLSVCKTDLTVVQGPSGKEICTLQTGLGCERFATS